MTHVIVTADFPQPLIDKIQAVSNQIKIEKIPIHKDGWPEGKTTSAEIIYTFKSLPPLHLAPNLHWVQLHSAGAEHMMAEPVWESDILITTASGIHSVTMAQYTIAQMLAWANRIPEWIANQKQGKWPEERWNKFLPTELRGKTIGILGYGSIGRELARICKAFGMKVLVTKRDVLNPADDGFSISGTGDPSGDIPARIYPPQATRSMVALCDYVVVTLPATESTYHLIDEEMLREMKEDSFLVNVGRGSVIDEKALIKALRKGWIGGAGLDVFEEEPLPDDSPFWQMENVLLTPHVSGFTPEYDNRATDLFAENMRRYLAGEPLLNLVNRELGY